MTAIPARSNRWSRVALARMSPVACHSFLSAAQSAAASASARSGKCCVHTSRQSSSWSKECQGVSVPPQSKMTALTVTTAL